MHRRNSYLFGIEKFVCWAPNIFFWIWLLTPSFCEATWNIFVTNDWSLFCFESFQFHLNFSKRIKYFIDRKLCTVFFIPGFSYFHYNLYSFYLIIQFSELIKLISSSSVISSFMYPRFTPFLVCLTTVPQPLPNRVLYTVRSSASCFSLQYTLVYVRSPSSCLLPRLRITSILSYIFPAILCFRRQFLLKMRLIQLAFHHFMDSKVYLSKVFLFICVSLYNSTIYMSHSRLYYTGAAFLPVNFPIRLGFQIPNSLVHVTMIYTVLSPTPVSNSNLSIYA